MGAINVSPPDVSSEQNKNNSKQHDIKLYNMKWYNIILYDTTLNETIWDIIRDDAILKIQNKM